jgi:transcriptional regulator with XRE-family HTH domain
MSSVSARLTPIRACVILVRVESFYREFGERVRRARGERFSQAELARRIGMSRGSIANIEAGNQRVPLHVLTVLARELSVEPVSLLPLGDTDPNDVVPADRLRRLLPEDQTTLQKVVRRAREQREAYGG